MGKLSTIEWEIYNYLKEETMKGNWTSVEKLANRFGIGKRTVRRHINTIRGNDVIQKIIISSFEYGYKIMTSEEEVEYLKNRKNAILKMLKQYYMDVKRVGLNGQCKITFGEYERNVFESLLKEK